MGDISTSVGSICPHWAHMEQVPLQNKTTHAGRHTQSHTQLKTQYQVTRCVLFSSRDECHEAVTRFLHIFAPKY